MNDNQPSYYQGDGASPMDCFRMGLISREEYIGFCKGNIIKYIVRGGKKDGNSALEDYGKARDYLDELIKITQIK